VLVTVQPGFQSLGRNNEETLTKSATFVSWVTLAMLLVAPGLGAQGSQEITVDVPFDFMVEQVMFIAGTYTVRPVGNQTFNLQAGRGRESVKFATEPIRMALHPSTGRLIFAEENGHYHLRELWMSSAIGVKIPGPQVKQLRTVARSRVEVPASCTTCK
jgi:hypothetical protein